MRAAPPGVLAIVLTLALLVPAAAAADAEKLTRDFLDSVQAANIDRAKRLYDPRYASIAKAGVDALFRYESGYQPNLAFLVGQPFRVDSVRTAGLIRSEWYVLDGVRGNNMTAHLRFDPGRGPFLLPSPIAFGRSMEFVDFLNFVRHPETGTFADLTLRLRPSVAPGVIAVTSSPPTVMVPPPPVGGGGPGRPMVVVPAPMLGGGLMGARPRDPGPVVLPSGDALTPEQLAALLPRLSAIDVMLTTMQRGRLASWKVEYVTFSEVLLESHGAHVPLR